MATHVGIVKFSVILLIKDVLYVLSFAYNLIFFISKLVSGLNYEVTVTSDLCVQDQKTKMGMV